MIKINLLKNKNKPLIVAEKPTVGSPAKPGSPRYAETECNTPEHLETQSLFNSDWYIMGTAGDKGV